MLKANCIAGRVILQSYTAERAAPASHTGCHQAESVFNIVTTPLHTSNNLHFFCVPILTKIFFSCKKSYLLYFVGEYHNVGLFVLLHKDGMHRFFPKVRTEIF